jgi:hypothetical protein
MWLVYASPMEVYKTRILYEIKCFIIEFYMPWSTYIIYEGNSISKLQIVIEKKRMEIMTYKQHLFFNVISIHI